MKERKKEKQKSKQKCKQKCNKELIIITMGNTKICPLFDAV